MNTMSVPNTIKKKKNPNDTKLLKRFDEKRLCE